MQNHPSPLPRTFHQASRKPSQLDQRILYLSLIIPLQVILWYQPHKTREHLTSTPIIRPPRHPVTTSKNEFKHQTSLPLKPGPPPPHAPLNRPPPYLRLFNPHQAPTLAQHPTLLAHRNKSVVHPRRISAHAAREEEWVVL